MKAIDKIMKMLGYAPTSSLKALEAKLKELDNIRYGYDFTSNVQHSIMGGKPMTATVIKTPPFWFTVGYVVENRMYPIKRFKVNDDKYYACLCAEELCEMLNNS